jgi:hypothetical protein
MNKLLVTLFQAFIFLFVYIVGLIIQRNIDPDGIIFYQGIRLILALAFMATIVYLLWIKNLSNTIDKLPVLFIGVLLCYSFLMTLPVVIDRSITLHFLGYLSKHSSAKVDEIRADFIDGFVIKAAAIEKRMDEQEATGNVKIIDGRVYVTSKGKLMHVVFDDLATYFKIKPTYVE